MRKTFKRTPQWCASQASASPVRHARAGYDPVSGCGGFQLSGYAEHLEEYFILDKEIVCYKTPGEMLEKIQFYLSHDDERIAIADAGYQRAVRDHTYEKRFNELFLQMGLE